MTFAASKEAEFAEIVPDRRVNTAAPLRMDAVMQIFQVMLHVCAMQKPFSKESVTEKIPCRAVK